MYKAVFLFLLLPLISYGQEKPVPEELKPFVKSGYEVLDWGSEDLNGDQRKDYILILKKQGEDTAGAESDIWTFPRLFMLLQRQKDYTLKTVVENKNLVMCRHCGGVMGDPYDGLTLKPGEIHLNFYGGSGFKWSITLFFRYDPLKENWLLQEENLWSFDAMLPEMKERNERITYLETGEILLKDFTHDHHFDSSFWLVRNKTYFYTSPELKSKPRKAYLLPGDKVKSWKNFKNFVSCDYTNKNGEISSGYILKKDLQRLPAQKPKAGQ